jgi:hypothetical protein
MSAAAPAPQITRADIEAKLRELQGGVSKRAHAAETTALRVGIGVAIVVVVVAFLIGRRKGKSQTTIVEIRRI